jgi:hypothetical protein
MADTAVVISAIGAVVSAIGGCFAAVAAFRSASSARAANEAAQLSEKRAALRQLSITASEILVETERANRRGVDLKNAYRTLFSFAGQSGGSRLGLYIGEVDNKLKEVETLSQEAQPFASGLESLMNGPLQEINAREITMTQALTKVRGTREDLEREHASIEAQNKTYRDKVIQGNAR